MANRTFWMVTFIVLISTLCSCKKDELIIDAHLTAVIDSKDWADWVDSLEYIEDSAISNRNMILTYKIVNTTNDSIFFPRERYDNNYLSIVIASRMGNNLSVLHKEGPNVIGPNDSTYMTIMIGGMLPVIEERTEKPSYADLLSQIKLTYMPSSQDQKNGMRKVKYVIFYNDTTTIAVRYRKPGVFYD